MERTEQAATVADPTPAKIREEYWAMARCGSGSHTHATRLLTSATLLTLLPSSYGSERGALGLACSIEWRSSSMVSAPNISCLSFE